MTLAIRNLSQNVSETESKTPRNTTKVLFLKFRLPIFFIPVMSHLCKTAEEITALDVRSTAEIWKSLMKISTVNAAVLIEKQDLKSDCFVWLSEAATFLTSEILLTVEKIIGKVLLLFQYIRCHVNLQTYKHQLEMLERRLSNYTNTKFKLSLLPKSVKSLFEISQMFIKSRVERIGLRTDDNIYAQIALEVFFNYTQK